MKMYVLVLLHDHGGGAAAGDGGGCVSNADAAAPSVSSQSKGLVQSINCLEGRKAFLDHLDNGSACSLLSTFCLTSGGGRSCPPN